MQTSNIQNFLNVKKLSRQQWTIFILCFFVILSDGIDTGVMGYIAPALIDQWQVSKNDLRPVMSSALIGMCLGALLSGILADKFGRKIVIIGSLLVFGLLTTMTGLSNSVQEIVIYRFLTGIGLGAAMPNAATLVSEYMPQHRRAWMVNLLFCALPLGMTVAGLFSAGLLGHFGWQPVLYISGAIPVIIALLALFWLKESLHILFKQHRYQEIEKILARIHGNVVDTHSLFTEKISNEVMQGPVVNPVKMVARHWFIPSCMMWICCFMSLLVFYVLSSWMPTLLKDAHYTPQQFSLISAIFPFGGVAGTIVIGWFMDRCNANKTIMIAYLISALLFLVTGAISQNIYLLAVFIFLAGGGLVGAQSSLPSLAATFYPPECRGVGVSWMHGIGRFGAIFGAFFGAMIFSFNLDISQIFMILALPIFISTLSIWIKGTHSFHTVTVEKTT